MNKKSSGSGFTLSVQVIVIAAIAWMVVALLFFLLFSVPEVRPDWYNPATYVLENMAFLAAGALCFRNWRSSQIVSGRTVWLFFFLGMISYFIGNLILGQWEVGWGKTPDISPADLFFLAMYLFLGIGMLLAVLARKLSLSLVQWLILGLIAVVGCVIAYFVAFAPASVPEAETPAIEQTAPAPNAPAAPGTAAPAVPAPAATEERTSTAPAWAIALEERLQPLSNFILPLYPIGDIILMVMASMLLLAFWGGRFSLSWRFIAAAAFSFYIADLWFFYANNYIENYETGALPEVFFIFSGCLFAIGAALEYGLSTRSRRGARRRA